MANDASKIQAMFPVFLPRAMQNGNDEEFNKGVAQNENALNQNFRILYETMAQILAIIGG